MLAARPGGAVPSRLAQAGHTACDVAERVWADRRQRPSGACMVEDAPQMRGAPAWHARGRWTAPVVSLACRAWLAGPARGGGEGSAAGGSTEGVEYGVRGGDPGRNGESGLSRDESPHGLSDLQLTAISNFMCT